MVPIPRFTYRWPPGLRNQPRHVWRHEPAGRDLRTDELEGRLSSVSMSGKAQIDPELGGAIERVGDYDSGECWTGRA